MVTAYKNNKNTVGTIGARLYYEDKTIQHSGMQFIIKNGAITIDHYGVGTHHTYHRGIKPVGGNTAALMMINRNLFKSIGGFNENYIECFEDVELNIECINRGKKNLFVSNAVSYHYESKTRKVLKERTERELKDYNERLLPKILSSMTKLKTHFYM